MLGTNWVEGSFAKEYTAAIEAFVAGQGETALHRAGEAGFRALSEGMSAGRILEIHHSAVGDALVYLRDGSREHLLKQCLNSLLHNLSQFETVLQSFRKRLEDFTGRLETIEGLLRCQTLELTSARHALDEERSRYRALSDFVPDAYLRTNSEGAILEANSSAAALLRVPKDLLAGRLLLDFLAEADREGLRERLRTDQLPLEWEISIHPTNASRVRLTLTAAADRSPLMSSELRVLIRNVSERERAKADRFSRVREAKARAEDDRHFKFLTEASALLLASLEVNENLVKVARLAASFYKQWCFICVIEAGGGLRQLEVAAPDAEFTELAKELSKHCLFGAASDGECDWLPDAPLLTHPITEDWWKRMADGPEHEDLLSQFVGCGVTILPLRSNSRLLGIMTLFETPARRNYGLAEQKLHESLALQCARAIENARIHEKVLAEREEAERSSLAKDESVAILSHELRNFLTPVVGWARIFKNHAPIQEDPVLAAGMNALERNAGTLCRLTSECLDLARISHGLIQVDRRLVDLNQIVTMSIPPIQEMASQRGLILETAQTQEPLRVLGDAMRLEQVVTNLFINAVKYTEPGGTVSIRTLRRDKNAEIEVRDSGHGIETTFLERIFEPYQQRTTSPLAPQSGLGLGLAIVRGIVEMHGGRVWAESPGLGLGSTFRLQLPSAEAFAEYQKGNASRIHPLPGNRITILLVEDSEDIRFLMKTELESMGHSVTVMSDGYQALRAAVTEPPDLLISDIKMPGVDGLELIRSVRRVPALMKIPAIALTGLGAKTDIERALASGFDACLTKPVEPKQLCALISELTDNG